LVVLLAGLLWWRAADRQPASVPAARLQPARPADGAAQRPALPERATDPVGELPPEAEPPEDHDQLLAEMVETAEQLVEDFPSNPWAHDLQGRVYSYLGKSAEARQAWQRCLELDPERPDACLGLAVLAIRRQDDELAERLLRRALRIDPTLHQAASRLADLLFRDGRMEAAREVLESFLAEVPESGRSLIQLGQIHLQLGELAEAESAFRSAVRLLPDASEAHFGLGTVLVRLRRPDEARKHLEQARQLKSEASRPKADVTAEAMDLTMTRANCAGAYYYAAQLYLREGRRREAERLGRRASLLDENHVACRLLLIEIYQQQRRISQAVEVCQQLLASDPGNPEWIWRLGLLNAQRRHYEAAEAAFREVIRLQPDRARAYVSLAEVYRRSSHGPQAALPLVRRAVQLEPAAAHFALLGQVYLQLGDREQALKALDESVRREPGNARYRRLREQLQRNP
jgi:cytochrome c-type biogenesis protein CcmH/NrfG